MLNLLTYHLNAPAYEEIKEKIGGWIEVIHFSNGDILVVDEEGKLKGLGVNLQATEVYMREFGTSHVIVGPAILIKAEARDPHWW